MADDITKLDNYDLLVLLEGDISEIEDGDFSDDDGNADELQTILQANTGNFLLSDQVNDAGPSGLSVEPVNPSEDEHSVNEQQAEAGVHHNHNVSPLVANVQASVPPARREMRWVYTDIEPVDSECNVVYADPPCELHTPLQYFKNYFDKGIVDFIVEQTNLYSVQQSGVSINTYCNELWQFLGIHIMSSIVKMPSYRMYWANETRYPKIADVMCRNRFYKLRRYLHFNDNYKMLPRDDPLYDKLFKIRPFIEAVRKNMLKVDPEEYHAVDEMIIPLKSHTSMKQYNKSKPYKWGVKVFARAGGKSGIIYDFEIYVGKGTVTNSDHNLGISGDVVMRLVEHLPKHRNFKVLTDNWFSSYSLAVALKEVGILTVATVRSNRVKCVFKSDRELKKSGRGSYDYRVEKNQNIFAIKWLDNKAVHLLSSYKGLNPQNNVQRWSLTEQKKISVSCPDVVREYNQHMGGVDLCDMLVELYRINIKSKRFYLRIFFHFVDVCIVNSWLVYRRHCTQNGLTKHKTLLVFRSEIASALLSMGTDPVRKRGRPSNDHEPVRKRAAVVPSPVSDVRFDSIGHWPAHKEQKSRCKLCITSYSRIMCVKCQVTLCLNKEKNCFVTFHCK